MDILVVGTNFRAAPLAVRERLSFPIERVPEVLQRLQPLLPDAELLLLSTCNRTELYVAGAGRMDGAEVGAALLTASGAEAVDLRDHLYHKSRQEAVEHLMAVATSLDSLVVGETEILGQVKQAYQQAVDAGTAGRILHAVLQQVLRVAKRVRTETDLSRGRVSVGSIAVDLAGRIFDDLPSKTAMVIGAGKIGQQATAALMAKGVREAYVVNRSAERGSAMAAAHGATALSLEQLAEGLPRSDIVICATSAPGTVLGVEGVRAAMAQRHGRPMLLIDLAVPRDIEAAVGELENVYLYSLDDLEGIARENQAKRQEAVGQAQQILRDEAAAVTAALRAETHGLSDVMRQLDEAAAAIEASEMARAFAKRRVAPFGEPCEQCREEIRAMLHRALAKMMAEPRKALTEAARNGNWDDVARLAALWTARDPAQEPQDAKERDET